MPVVTLESEALPCLPQCYADWKKEEPLCTQAYDLVLEAEKHARHERNDDKIVSARVVGYLLIELFARSKILPKDSYRCVAEEITSEPREQGGGPFALIFEIGKRYRDRFLRLCASLSFPTSLSIMISYSLDNHHHVPRILTAPFTR